MPDHSNRRGFLRKFGVIAATAALIPEAVEAQIRPPDARLNQPASANSPVTSYPDGSLLIQGKVNQKLIMNRIGNIGVPYTVINLHSRLDAGGKVQLWAEEKIPGKDKLTGAAVTGAIEKANNPVAFGLWDNDLRKKDGTPVPIGPDFVKAFYPDKDSKLRFVVMMSAGREIVTEGDDVPSDLRKSRGDSLHHSQRMDGFESGTLYSSRPREISTGYAHIYEVQGDRFVERGAYSQEAMVAQLKRVHLIAEASPHHTRQGVGDPVPERFVAGNRSQSAPVQNRTSF